MAPKKETEKPWVGVNTGCFSNWWLLLGERKLVPKKLKELFFFQYMLYSLKAHAHYFTVFIYLETWRGTKLSIFTHFTFTNLPWCSQSMNSLMNSLIYVYSLQIPSWSQTWSHFFVLLLPPQKNFCITPWWVFNFDLGVSTKKGRVSTPGKSGNLLEDPEKFWKKSGKKIFIHANF